MMMAKVVKVLLLSLLVILGSNARSDVSAGLDQLFSEHLQSIQGPGFSAAVVHDGALVYSRGFGLASIAETRPMTQHNILAIGSTTKSITAFAILQLQERGLLNIDDPVRKYLPWFELSDKSQTDKITLRMFLSNSSGVVAQFSTLLENQSRRADALEQNVRAMSSYHVAREPGTSFEYLNEGWNTLGLIIETITGMSWSEYVAENIFQPLEMARTSTIRKELEQMPVENGHYSGIEPIPARFMHLRGSLPAGSGTFSTAEDMGRYVQMLMNRGEYKGSQLLSADSVERLWSPQVEMSQILSDDLGGSGESGHYGFGWGVFPLDGHLYVSHGGEYRTMSSQILMDPENRNGVVLIYNTGELDPYYSESYYRISHNVLRFLRGLPPSDFAKPRVADETINSFTPDSSELDAYLGTYLAPSGFRIDIVRGGSEGLLALSTEAVYYAEYDVDFANSSNFVLRNIANHHNGFFARPEAGKVPSLRFQGQTYLRKRPLPERYQARSHAPSGLQYVLPETWLERADADGFIASTIDSDDTSLELRILPSDPDDWIETYSARHNTSASMDLSELVGGLVLQGKLLELEDGAKGSARVEYLLGTNLRDQQVLIRLQSPRHQLTHLLTELLLPFLESLQYR